VTIRATVTKTIRVEADGEDEATEAAHLLFTTKPEVDQDEIYYSEECLSVEEVSDDKEEEAPDV